MKKIKILTTVASMLLVTIALNAQNEDNALRYSYDRPSGTARSIGLGGAMGALGGDYSAIGINPAGIAVYRSNEFSFTPSLIFSQTESNYYGTTTDDDKFSLPINHISYVGTNRSLRNVESGLVSTHFGIGYNRNNNYNRKSFIQGDGVQSSLLDMYIQNVGDIHPDLLDDKRSPNYDPFYLRPAFDTYLIDTIPNNGYYIHGYEYLDEEYNPQFGAEQNGINQIKSIEESGYSGQFDITFGANFGNTFHIGASLGIATLNYEKTSSYTERIVPDYSPESSYQDYIYYRELDSMKVLDDFFFEEYERTSGTGINLNIGFLYKPINSIRIGASFLTPTFYSMDMEFDTKTTAYYFNSDNYEMTSPLGESSFNFRTPYKATGSFAYIFGTNGLISLDYEYTDYSSMQYKSNNNGIGEKLEFDGLNQIIKETFQETHNIRVGAEYRITPMVAIRGGYALFQNPYREEFLNSEGEHFNITGGLGFRQGNMTIDLAYLYREQSYIHSLYYSPALSDDIQQPADMTSTDHQLAVTLGWRF